MWREDELPLVDFYRLCHQKAHTWNYRILICLIARYAESPEVYEEIEKAWTSLHDLTGSRILFLFAGDGVNNHVISNDVIYEYYSLKYRDKAVVYSNAVAILPQGKQLDLGYSKFNYQQLKVGTPRLKKGHELFDSHTLQISELRDFLSIPESSIPCLHFTDLIGDKSDYVELKQASLIYNLLKEFIIRIQEDRILGQINYVTNLENKLKEKIEKLKKIRQHFKLYLKCLNCIEQIESKASTISQTLKGTDNYNFKLTIANIISLRIEKNLEYYRSKSEYFNALNTIRSILKNDSRFRDIKPIIQRFFDLSWNAVKDDARQKNELKDCDPEQQLAIIKQAHELESYIKTQEEEIRNHKKNISNKEREQQEKFLEIVRSLSNPIGNSQRPQQKVNTFHQNHQQYMADSDNCIRILHLSDIHLGTVEQANRYFSQLATDLTQNLNIKQLNYLVISGDIANRSTEDEYDAAFYLVDKLVTRYGLDPNRVVIVPGNHDLNWDLSETAYPFVAKRKLPNPLPEGRYIEAGSAGALICDEAEYKQRFTYFSDRFYKKVYGKPYPLEYDQQAILHPCPQDKILFLALNSCWEIDHHYRDRAGIHSNAIANAVDQILSENYDDWLKIAVWHHPVNGSESMKNPAFLEQLAVHEFQLGIHGHIHEAKDENFQYDTKRGLRIIAAGTFGAPTHEQVTGIPLQYNLLTLDPETGELTVETRKKEKADGAWSADARWGDKNNPIPRYPIQLRYGSEKKKTDDAANSPQALTEGNSSNPQQSILSNVKVGGSMTVGSIYQYYGFGTAPQPAQPAQPTPIPPLKRTILFLASSPINEARLRLDVEMREIDNGLRLAQQRDRFVIEQRWAVRTDDLRRALLDLNPEIVHFCGHGAGAGGLVLENDAGQAKLASTEALARLFKLFTNPVRCVVLNACYSNVQADAICQHIDYVVGMSDAVSDAAAIKFAVGFYDALVRERSYEDAFDFGCNAIEFENLPEELTPVLKKKPS